MIALLGGTSETAGIAARLTAMGLKVTALTATEIPLNVGPEGVTRRAGRLDAEEMARLFTRIGARAVVDVTHPFATIARANARQAAKAAGAPYLTYVRPSAMAPYEKLLRAVTHEEAADIAFSFNAPVLLTTGSKVLAPYARRAGQTGVALVARVLDHPDSVAACLKAGIARENIISERGPFTVEENLEHIGRYGIGVMVTKDSGAAGGTLEKIEAARGKSIPLIMVERASAGSEGVFDTIEALAAAVAALAGR